ICQNIILVHIGCAPGKYKRRRYWDRIARQGGYLGRGIYDGDRLGATGGTYIFQNLEYTVIVKIILPLQGYILVAGDPRISHNGRTAPRLCLYQGPLRFKGPCMVGPKLMPQFMGDKIDIVMISLRGNGGRIGTALPGIYTDRCDIPGVPAILIFVKEMANIVIGCPYDRI